MILPKTEELKRYPHIRGSALKGIVVYGTHLDNGRKVYKIPGEDLGRVEKLGYQLAKIGSSYAYVAQ